jgi:hypothetical protein
VVAARARAAGALQVVAKSMRADDLITAIREVVAQDTSDS